MYRVYLLKKKEKKKAKKLLFFQNSNALETIQFFLDYASHLSSKKGILIKYLNLSF